MAQHHGQPYPSAHFGWTAVPRSLSAFLENASEANVKPHTTSDFAVPSSAVAVKTIEYARANLPAETFNHSMRVFYYGLSLLHDNIPNSLEPESPFIETFFLTCMLHDIGSKPSNLTGTRLSFELWGAVHSLNLLPTFGAPVDQAEAVAEAINRHQDLGETGSVTTVLALVYFGTLFDNVGANPNLVHKKTIEQIVAEFPRLGWSGCFAKTIKQETELKPWSHTTVIDKFAEKVEGNELMKPYEK